MNSQLGERVAAVLALACILVAPYIHPAWAFALLVIVLALVLLLVEKTTFFSVSIIALAIFYGIGLIPLFIFSCTLAFVVIGELAFRSAGENVHAYFAYIVVAAASAILITLYLHETAPLPVLFGVIAAVLLKAILGDRDDALMVETLGISMTMLLINDLDYQVSIPHLSLAIVIAFVFGYFAYRFNTADLSGLFSASLIGVILLVFTNVYWFLVMLTFFIVGSVCTRYQFEYKEKLGVEQTHGGARGYRNVFANGGVSAAAAMLFGVTMGNPLFAAMYVGSVASAAADTVASEIGVTGGSPYMITTFKRVPPGTNGGITLIGELAALAASLIIS
ncbi:MAG TPA: DUF92 domain-containing protein, partial [Methanoregulaceae archaeon]|nr:DUF92 domain-containing protein [Methanoregulaceae archaeon]